jgi:hypothetical protein
MSDYRDANLTILVGDAVERLRDIPAESVQAVVTSPPYFHLALIDADGLPWCSECLWCAEHQGELVRQRRVRPPTARRGPDAG